MKLNTGEYQIWHGITRKIAKIGLKTDAEYVANSVNVDV